MRDAPREDELLFVYGSLMSGLAAADLLADATYQGPARTAPRFQLVALNGYPGLVPGEASIRGELYRVPDTLWPRLDRYEGAPHLYQRTTIEMSDGRQALAYLLTPGYAPAAEPTDAVDWRHHRDTPRGRDPSR